MFSRGFQKDRNGVAIPLIPGKRPTAVQRLTTVVSSGAVNSAALNANTKMVRITSADFNCYVRIKSTGFASAATNTAWDFYILKDQANDFVLPARATETGDTFTLSILGKGTVTELVISEY